MYANEPLAVFSLIFVVSQQGSNRRNRIAKSCTSPRRVGISQNNSVSKLLKNLFNLFAVHMYFYTMGIVRIHCLDIVVT